MLSYVGPLPLVPAFFFVWSFFLSGGYTLGFRGHEHFVGIYLLGAGCMIGRSAGNHIAK